MPKKLLLADDSITIQKVVGITFAQEDFDITYVDNGADAITKAQSLRPDIVLADIVMPQKNGYDVCESIKKNPELKQIPVLLLAGTFETFDVNRGKLVGADDYIIKPFESQALIDKVNSLLQGKSAPKSVAAVPPPISAKPAVVAPSPSLAAKVAVPTPPPVVEAQHVQPEPSNDFSFDTSGTFDLTADLESESGGLPIEKTVVEADPMTMGGSEEKVELASAAELMMGASTGSSTMSGDGVDLPASGEFNFSGSGAMDQFGLDTPMDQSAGGELDLPPLTEADTIQDHGQEHGGEVFSDSSVAASTAHAAASMPSAVATPTISEAEVRKMVEARVKELIEKVAWEVVPDMAERVIQEEIRRLTREG